MIHNTVEGLIRRLEGGSLSGDLDDALRDVVEGCALTGGAGALTLSLSFKPNKHGQINIVPTIKAKVPELDRMQTLMFVTPDNGLSDEHPRQQKLDIGAGSGSGPINNGVIVNEQ